MVLPEKTAIIIIGGGVMGCSIAYRLAKAGQNIVLLESRNIASGASGRNGGMVMQLDGRDFDKDAILNRLTYTRKNNRILENLADELGADLEYTKCGSLDLAWTEKELEYLQKLVKFQKKLGDTEIQLLDRKETKEKCPLITSCALGSRFRSSDGTINPFKLTYGFASRAKKYGAKIFTGVEVKKIVIKDGEVKGVETALGHIKSNWVINATNAWAPNLTGEIDILPLRQVAVVTERVPALV
ncbi:MAG: FAD-binding oxidoreductase [Elusimicrobia bacterium]|nr:FAD-binding oxidoreductase [Elusimicrobiota bacterium]